MSNTHTTGYYFAPPSHWPVVGSAALFMLAIGAVLLFNSYGVGWLPFAAGFFTLVYMLFGWFGTVIRESEGGLFNQQVDGSFRWAMSWFIFSEVMFFAAFFGALFYARVYSLPWLGDIDNKLLWPDFASPTGTVWVTYGSRSTSVPLRASDNGSVTVTLAKLPRGTYTVRVLYVSSDSRIGSGAAAPLTLTVR